MRHRQIFDQSLISVTDEIFILLIWIWKPNKAMFASFINLNIILYCFFHDYGFWRHSPETMGISCVHSSLGFRTGIPIINSLPSFDCRDHGIGRGEEGIWAILSPSEGITHSPNHKLLILGSTTDSSKKAEVHSAMGLVCAGGGTPVSTHWRQIWLFYFGLNSWCPADVHLTCLPGQRCWYSPPAWWFSGTRAQFKEAEITNHIIKS